MGEDLGPARRDLELGHGRHLMVRTALVAVVVFAVLSLIAAMFGNLGPVEFAAIAVLTALLVLAVRRRGSPS